MPAHHAAPVRAHPPGPASCCLPVHACPPRCCTAASALPPSFCLPVYLPPPHLPRYTPPHTPLPYEACSMRRRLRTPRRKDGRQLPAHCPASLTCQHCLLPCLSTLPHCCARCRAPLCWVAMQAFWDCASALSLSKPGGQRRGFPAGFLSSAVPSWESFLGGPWPVLALPSALRLHPALPSSPAPFRSPLRVPRGRGVPRLLFPTHAHTARMSLTLASSPVWDVGHHRGCARRTRTLQALCTPNHPWWTPL